MKYESDDEELMPRAFMVEEEELNIKEGPPTTGEDYLKMVRREAKNYPEIVISNINPREFDKNQSRWYFQNLPKILKAPPGFEPKIIWQKKFLKYFEKLQKKLEYLISIKNKNIEFNKLNVKLPSIKDSKKWKYFCFGTSKKLTEEKNSEQNNQPLLKIILNLKEIDIITLIDYQIQWLNELVDSILKEILKNENFLIIIPTNRWLWLFALFSRLHKPLNADTASSLRQLLRLCCNIRYRMKNPLDPQLAAINIIIIIIAKYFGQQEPEEEI
jgi:survival of motor neuron protein-interacting protein 1